MDSHSIPLPKRLLYWIGFVLFFPLFLMTGQQALAQAVTGTVTEAETGETLPGVNILLKGTTLGTTSDIGRYSLTIQGHQAVFVFSFVGYNTQEAAVGNLTQVNVSLEPDLSELNEVVVVGYGTVKKSSVTSAISKIEDDKLHRWSPSASPQIIPDPSAPDGAGS